MSSYGALRQLESLRARHEADIMSEESKDAIIAIVIAVSLNIIVGAFWVIQILKGTLRFFGETAVA